MWDYVRRAAFSVVALFIISFLVFCLTHVVPGSPASVVLDPDTPEEEIGEERNNETHIIPLAIEASRKLKTFNLYGTNYLTDDGTCVRDYVHVMDLADAHVKALNYANQNLVCEQINLGSGEPVSNRQLLNVIQKHTGKMDIQFLENRAGDPAYLVADISKAKKILNWFPEQSSIDNIVAIALKWYNKLNKKNIQ